MAQPNKSKIAGISFIVFTLYLLLCGYLFGSERPAFIVRARPTEKVYHLKTARFESFKIAYSARNITKEPQQFRVWTGCYGWNWKTDNALIFVGGQSCLANFAAPVTVKAGGSYKGQIAIRVDEQAPKGCLQFRLGFQPLEDNAHGGVGSKKLGPFWSNTVRIEIED